MATKKNNDASSTKTMDACESSDVSPWQDLTHDVLFIVMMKLAGVIDFVSFSGVCKSWRALAIPNRKMFMASKPHFDLTIYAISSDPDEKYFLCELRDFDRRKFKTLLPTCVGRRCLGIVCGYLIFYGEVTKDYLLVNPFTSHQLHFPRVPVDVDLHTHTRMNAILVFSRSVSAWLFVMFDKKTEDIHHKIWLCTAGKGGWNYVFSTFPIHDIIAFKGKIYTLTLDSPRSDVGQLCELRPNPEPKLTLLKTNTFPKIDNRLLGFASCGEKFYIYQQENALVSADLYEIQVVEIGEMKFVYRGKRDGYDLEMMNHVEWLSETPPFETPPRLRIRIYTLIRYFPHKCFNVNLID